MSDERDNEFPSVEQVAALDAFLDRLVDDRRPAPRELTAQEATERMVAAQLRLARDDVEAPTPDYLAALERTVARAVAEHSAQETRPRRHPRFSRGGFLRAAATLAGGDAVLSREAAWTSRTVPVRASRIMRRTISHQR